MRRILLPTKRVLPDCFAVNYTVLDSKKERERERNWIKSFGFAINCTYFLFKMIYFVLLNFIVYLKNVKYNQFPE